MPIVVNLFGTGIRYWVWDAPLDVYEEMNAIRSKHDVTWDRVLFDLDFLKHFGYSHWSELSRNSEQTGFHLIRENRMEVKQKTKFLAKWRASELLNQETLFPLFRTNITNFQTQNGSESERFILIQEEKGLISKFSIESENFELDLLEFELSRFEDRFVLSALNYNGHKLRSITEDTLVTGLRVIKKQNQP